MGIQGLLPFLKDESVPINISKYKGLTVAVDVSCWMHKGAYACSWELAQGKDNLMYVGFCVKYLNLLLSLDVKPVLVFDGQPLKAKEAVNEQRRERRRHNLERGKQLMRSGDTAGARQCFSQAVTVTPQMCRNVMQACRERGVDCIVAPYEADAQIAHLLQAGIAQAVVSEDSDLLPFGCHTVLFKLDLNGSCLELSWERIRRSDKMEGFDQAKFRHMCILAGCDYLPDNIPGVALRKAHKALKLVLNNDIRRTLKKLGTYLKGKVEVPDAYIERFIQADNTFKHQLVYDPLARRLRPLTPYPPGASADDFPYAGRVSGESQAFQMALGNIDPKTLQYVDSYCPDNRVEVNKKLQQDQNVVCPKASTPRHRVSIWSRDYKPYGEAKFESQTVPLQTSGLSSPSMRKPVSTDLLKEKFGFKNSSEPVEEEYHEWKKLTRNPDDYCMDPVSAQELTQQYLADTRPAAHSPAAAAPGVHPLEVKRSGGSTSSVASRRRSTRELLNTMSHPGQDADVIELENTPPEKQGFAEQKAEVQEARKRTVGLNLADVLDKQELDLDTYVPPSKRFKTSLKASVNSGALPNQNPINAQEKPKYQLSDFVEQSTDNPVKNDFLQLLEQNESTTEKTVDTEVEKPKRTSNPFRVVSHGNSPDTKNDNGADSDIEEIFCLESSRSSPKSTAPVKPLPAQLKSKPSIPSGLCQKVKPTVGTSRNKKPPDGQAQLSFQPASKKVVVKSKYFNK